MTCVTQSFSDNVALLQAATLLKIHSDKGVFQQFFSYNSMRKQIAMFAYIIKTSVLRF